MPDFATKIPIPESLTQGQLQPQAETLQVPRKGGKLFIGIPKERTLQENRVALVPSSVATLIGLGHRVVIESGAGKRSNYSDFKYAEIGAEIVHSKEEVFKADVLVKVAPVTLNEIDLLRPNQVLISPLHLPILTEEYLHRLRQKRVIALAMEYIKDENGIFPVVRIMSELAGIGAILTAAELLSKTSNGRGVLLAGISGVPPAKIVILGAGVVAESAIRAALGLGAEIRVFDNNVYKLMRLQQIIGRSLNTSTINPMQLEKELLGAEVAIGAIHSQHGRATVVVSEDMVMKMKKGAVIVDVSIDQGGCFETSEVTSHDKPTFIKHDVIHYCIPNIASKVPRTASIAVSNILTPLLSKAGTTGGVANLLFSNHSLRNGVYIYKGAITNEYLANRFNMQFTDIDLLLTSSI